MTSRHAILGIPPTALRYGGYASLACAFFLVGVNRGHSVEEEFQVLEHILAMALLVSWLPGITRLSAEKLLLDKDREDFLLGGFFAICVVSSFVLFAMIFRVDLMRDWSIRMMQFAIGYTMINERAWFLYHSKATKDVGG